MAQFKRLDCVVHSNRFAVWSGSLMGLLTCLCGFAVSECAERREILPDSKRDAYVREIGQAQADLDAGAGCETTEAATGVRRSLGDPLQILAISASLSRPLRCRI